MLSLIWYQLVLNNIKRHHLLHAHYAKGKTLDNIATKPPNEATINGLEYICESILEWDEIKHNVHAYFTFKILDDNWDGFETIPSRVLVCCDTRSHTVL